MSDLTAIVPPPLAVQADRLGFHEGDGGANAGRSPISVVFESDSVTEVAIRGVGTLGNFARRDVPLKPGRYVVVGRRNGYRDTRSEISVIPGRQQPVVEVRCEEKI